MPARPPDRAGLYERIHELVRTIPPGRVATYGQLADLVGSCTARMAGYAMAALPEEADVPWQRVINSRGEVSLRCRGAGHSEQRLLLEREGVEFDGKGRVDLGRYGWEGPESMEHER